MQNSRINKIDSELKKALAEVINYKLQVSLNGALVSVTEVRTTSDLEHSEVFLSIYSPKTPTDQILKILNENLSFIRKETAQIVKLRAIPKFKLTIDKGMEYAQKINDLLSTIKIPEENGDE